MIIAPTLDTVRNGLPIDLEVCREIPSKVRHPNDDQTTPLVSRSGVAYRGCREEDENEKNLMMQLVKVLMHSLYHR